jgi:bifunctional non-homologous end joining protein LigD
MALARFPAMPAVRVVSPFDDLDWIWEPKLDGWRALAYVEGRQCQLVSRHDRVIDRWLSLAVNIARSLNVRNAILDGEIVCLDEYGHTRFIDLMKRDNTPVYYSFDLLWLDDEDLRGLELIERKRRLRAIVPPRGSRVHYVDHVTNLGEQLFAAVCQQDVEGVVGKWARARYTTDGSKTTWVQVPNPTYSQARPHEPIDRKRRTARMTGAPELVISPEAIGKRA